MFILHFYRWLVGIGLWRDVVGTMVPYYVVRILGARIWKRYLDELEAQAKHLERISDLLNPKTPGGITELIDELKRQRQ